MSDTLVPASIRVVLPKYQPQTRQLTTHINSTQLTVNCKTTCLVMKYLNIFALALLSATQTDALAAPSPTRREALSAGWATASLAFLSTAAPAFADDAVVLSDEEMAARIARKQALKNASKPSGRDQFPASATDIRSDVNPEAAANLRARSLQENTKIAMEKQKELKSRDKSQKREDLCEMLGRGC